VIGAGELRYKESFKVDSTISFSNGTNILQKCLTNRGNTPTRYSTGYDLKTGDISVFRFLDGDNKGAHFNLFDELKKGAHYYNISKLEKEIDLKPQALEIYMKRLCMFDFEAIQAPLFENQAKQMINDWSKGTINENQYTKGYWENLEEDQIEIKKDLVPYGLLQSFHTLDYKNEDDLDIYYFLAIYKNGRILWKLTQETGALTKDLTIKNLWI
jgi:hypothetical protein